MSRYSQLRRAFVCRWGIVTDHQIAAWGFDVWSGWTDGSRAGDYN